jgi:hypothetical protein
VVYVPAAHNVHPVLPAWEYMPGGHSSTLVTPLVVATIPPTAPLVVQVTPASLDWNMLPDVAVAAANFLKSGEAVTPYQVRTPAPARAVHVTPLSMDENISPFKDDATSLLKSGEDAIPRQLLLPAPVKAVQLTPPSLDMWILPPSFPSLAAAIFTKLGDAVTASQFLIPAPIRTLHVVPPSRDM